MVIDDEPDILDLLGKALNIEGFDKEGFNVAGFNKDGINKETGKPWDKDGLDEQGRLWDLTTEKPADGLVKFDDGEELMYQDGKIFTGILEDVLYEQGLLFTGTKDGIEKDMNV